MAARTRIPPGQEALWERLCEEADAFAATYWAQVMDAYGPSEPMDLWRWIDEADDILWRGSGGSRTRRPALIVEWWARRVGARQARTAIRCWQQEVSGK